MTDERSQRGIVAAECFADGQVGLSELVENYNAAQEAWSAIRVAFRGKQSQPQRAARACAEDEASAEIARNAADPELGLQTVRICSWRDTDKTIILLSTILRDLFANPVHHLHLDSSWLAWNDGAIRKMAQAIYDDRSFDRLPLLADALEEAGCTDAVILGHCRGGGEHVRGCWVVDLLLGKE